MTHNWTLVRSPKAKDELSLLEEPDLEAIGPLETTKTDLAKLFPTTRWQPSSAFLMKDKKIEMTVGLGGGVTFGLAAVAGQVLYMTVSAKQKTEIERVASELQLKVLGTHAFGG